MDFTDLLRIPRTYKNLQRVREILGVVAKYGWGDLVARLALESPVERGRRTLARRGRRTDPNEERTTEERVRMALEELGPTFVKLGQILATRADLVPLSLMAELSKLQDSVAPFPHREAEAQIQAELGRPVSELFADFQAHPLAAASMAQVHRATLPGGREVVVKVRRPRIAETVERDIDILQGLAALVEENLPETRHLGPRAIVYEFAHAIRRELDFRNEAANLGRFARNFEADARVRVPEAHAELCSAGVLTLDFVEGIKANDLEALDQAGVDRPALARLGVDVVLLQVFRHGFFHADPHPGNLFVVPEPEPAIAFIDMGMMGHLDRATCDLLLELLVGVLLRDGDKVARLFSSHGLVAEDADLVRLRRDVEALIDEWLSRPLGEVDVSAFLAQLFEALGRHRVNVPPELFLMAKALATMEGNARALDPTLNPVEAMRPFLMKLYLERLSDPTFVARDWIETGRRLSELAHTAPRDLRQIFADLRRGALTVGVRQQGFELQLRERSRDANRLALALVIAAGLVSSSLLLGQEAGPVVFGLRLSTLLALTGFAGAGAGTFVLAFGFLRSGRF